MHRIGSVIRGKAGTLDFLAHEDKGAAAHASRDFHRLHLFASIEERRPREYEGLHVGINLDWLRRCHEALHDPRKLSAFRRLVLGSFMCRERCKRHSSRNKFVDPRCVVCLETETVPHITSECTRHSFAFHRTYLQSLEPASAARLARNAIPLMAPDIVAAGFESYMLFVQSVLCTLIQRDIDNSVLSHPDVGTESRLDLIKRRIRGKQPRPPAFVENALEENAFEDSAAPVEQARTHNTVTSRFLAGISFDDEGVWHVQGHRVTKEGVGADAVLTCEICKHHKLWKWRHLWAGAPCAGPRSELKVRRARRCVAWHCHPQHINVDMQVER
eukprot:2345883-Amphidinium_carterae.1